ncbi:hypothetical protein D6858_01950 [Tsuneonella suprasediminis]|uniref:Uncharacterized protein n=1 Tax=Tsuneonella suprasediminis TaxID=2306996 RepID=A0A419R5T8_9SPHN|nr:hypothetical protein [Tsuneonella suprasediminis]RJX70765.1 hypothetical protein D6858_01950 [Tsuneonella suprasediminis]
MTALFTRYGLVNVINTLVGGYSVILACLYLGAARSALEAGNRLAQIPATISFSLAMFVLSHRFMFADRS